MKLIRNLLKANKGSISVEFSLTIGAFIIVFFMIFELARLAFASSYYDFVLAESVRVVKNQQVQSGNYADELKRIIKKQFDDNSKDILSIVLLGVKENNIDVDVKYADTVDDLVKEKFRASSSGTGAPLALYTISYDYEFLAGLPLLPSTWVNNVFNRKILVVQEYERSLFKYQ